MKRDFKEKRQTIDDLIIQLGQSMTLAEEVSKAFYDIRKKIFFAIDSDQYRNNGEQFVHLVIKFVLRKVTSDWKVRLAKEKTLWAKEFSKCQATKDVDDIIKLIKKKNKNFKKVTKTQASKNLREITQEDFLLNLCMESRDMHMVVIDYLRTAEELMTISAVQDAKTAKLLDEIDNELIGRAKDE